MTDSRKTDIQSQRKKILWISFIILDIYLHKTSRIEILRHLAKRGYTVCLFAVRSRNRYEIEDSNIHVISIPLRYIPVLSPFFFLGILLLALPYYILYLRPNYVITEPGISIFSFVWVGLLSKLFRARLILDVRSTPVETVGLRGYLKLFFFSASISVAKSVFDGMTTITTLMRDEIRSKFHINSEIGVWTSGVSTRLFDPETSGQDGANLRERFRLSDKFIIFHHGNFGIKRGITNCIRSIEALKTEYSDVVLFLLGSGLAFQEIERIIAANGIQDKVIIHTPVDYEKVPKYVAMCDVAIVPLPNIPDWRHQCPLKILEYLAMEKPVLLTDIPAHREIVGSNKCGIYMPSDPRGIASAIKFAYNNREKLQEWGELGREIVIRKYDWDRVADDLEHYILSLK